MEMTRRYVNLAAADITSDYDRFSPLATTKKKASRTKNIKEPIEEPDNGIQTQKQRLEDSRCFYFLWYSVLISLAPER